MPAGLEFCLLGPLVVQSGGTVLPPVRLGDPGHQQDRTGGRHHGPAEYQCEPDTSHGPARPAPPAVSRALLGRSRARLLSILDEPASTTELAGRRRRIGIIRYAITSSVFACERVPSHRAISHVVTVAVMRVPLRGIAYGT